MEVKEAIYLRLNFNCAKYNSWCTEIQQNINLFANFEM